MLTYSFASLGSDSLYQHLYKCIKNDILQGVLAPGGKIPSKRSFAKNLNISTITIENAYAQLMAEGYIYSIPKKGYFVSDITNSISPKAELNSENIIAAANQSEYFADFLSNRTNHANFPFSIWAKIMREIISEESEALMTNPPCGGIIELRQAISDYLHEFRGMNVSPNQIIIGAGTEYLYGLLIQLLGHDKKFGVEDPGYKKIAQIYSSNSVKCHFIPLDENGISIPALEESLADIVHISPSHHYPTGIITPISRRYELLGWASKSESRYIIEDDYDCEFRLLGKPIPALQSIDVMEKVIYMNTFTKSLASTIRISYMILPEHLLDRFYSKLGFYSCTVSNFEQYTLAKFIKNGYFEKHINRMRNFYRNQRDAILQCIKNSPLSSSVKIKEEDSGLHFLMHINTSLSDETIIHRAEQEGLRISCLSQYYHKDIPGAEHTLIINYSGIEPNKIQEAIDRLSKCIR
ncbi:MocR-like pyridoxine biosynthesis transcription factor PdxR [Acetivibrio cellulolyticus]|uniref:MocR-like pyridoxine biosynthesis transcription factor PdxR n=1 Tax=Acetivibrio cellulolyticus TaxID=35830 RepID=UPI0001E2F07F|nr:PLP-dependent aminotransferase family protein [Acetivibrio cellulolyticus]